MSEPRADILCPGPSLQEWPGRHPAAVTIAVNRAAGLILPHGCHLWVALDARAALLTVRGLGWPEHPALHGHRPRILSWTAEYRAMCEAEPQLAEFGLLPILPGRLAENAATAWTHFGLLAAVEAAFRLGCTEVDVWGADWRGSADADGYADSAQSRTPGRWRREREMFDVLAAHLDREHGVAVTRHAPQEVPA